MLAFNSRCINLFLTMVTLSGLLDITACKLVQLKSNKLTGPEDMHYVDHKSRTKRSKFVSSAKQDLVDIHNRLRRQEGSSNMEHMVWNEYLADMAEDWAKRCVWEHGQPDRDKAELPFTYIISYIGQNLYAYTGSFDPLEGIQIFYDEKDYYSYNTGACSKKPCGHYTQVVWSDSRELGCAYSYCPKLGKTDLTKANYLVCNYGPGGNWVGQKPFKKGAACTQCKSGSAWCDDGLCRSDCSSPGPSCECRAQCHNCGEVVTSNCTCKCAIGWTGVDCSEVCEDRDVQCGANPGWPKYWCDKDYVISKCPLLCGLCTPGSTECSTGSSVPPWAIAIIAILLVAALIVGAVLIAYYILMKRQSAPSRPVPPRRPTAHVNAAYM